MTPNPAMERAAFFACHAEPVVGTFQAEGVL